LGDSDHDLISLFCPTQRLRIAIFHLQVGGHPLENSWMQAIEAWKAIVKLVGAASDSLSAIFH
jgi:hypothetical protein